MSSKKTKKDSGTAPARVVVLKSGKRLPLVGENDRYWLCQGTQFRKSGDQVARVEEVPAVDLSEAVDEAAAEGAAEERETVEGVREEEADHADERE